MRQAEVQSLFLDSFGTLYPQLTFRAVRRLPQRIRDPFGLILRVTFGKSGIEMDLLCVALTEGLPQEVERFIRRVTQTEVPPSETEAIPILVAPYLGEDARALCHATGVGYFDLAGNAWIETARVFLLLSGKTNVHVRERKVQAPFEGKAERVARLLLLEPERRWNMRDLAQAAEISLGLASMVTTALAEKGVLIKRHAGLELYDPGALLNAWAPGYDLRRSAYHIYRTGFDRATLEARLVDHPGELGGQGALTLWSGAYHLLQEDNPTPRLALYWSGKPEPLIRIGRLTEDKGSTFVFVFQPYDESVLWQVQEARNRLAVVHPLQLYLDLASGDEDELRLAQRVRARFLPW